MELALMFGVPFLIGYGLGFIVKKSLDRYEKSKRFDKHMDSLFKE